MDSLRYKLKVDVYATKMVLQHLLPPCNCCHELDQSFNCCEEETQCICYHHTSDRQASAIVCIALEFGRVNQADRLDVVARTVSSQIHQLCLMVKLNRYPMNSK